MEKEQIIAYDLDATTAVYNHGDIEKNGLTIGPPIQEMVDEIKRGLANGEKSVIFSARITPSDDSYQELLDATQSYLNIAEWCQQHIGQLLPITNVKLRTMHRLVDDRADQVIPNTGVHVTDMLEAEASQR